MRIEQVTAHAFGPLTEQTLAFAPGMTVVVGDNEAAKSSWHQATYAALAGRRRAQGRSKEDKEFEDAHRPWNLPAWAVSAVVVCDDGRRIQLTQDLAGKVECTATDLDLGRDLTAELSPDRALDATTLVGLNRRAFAATASASQTQVMAMLGDEAAGVAKLLEAATASAVVTGAPDASATKALAILKEFTSQHVGLDRGNSTKPLRAAIVRVETAKATVESAKEVRAKFDAQAEDAARLEADARAAGEQVRAARAAAALAEATEIEDRSARAAQLAAQLGPDRPVTEAAATGLVATVTEAVTAWERLPAVPEAGEDPEALAARLAALPGMPTHHTSPDAQISSLAGRVSGAVKTLADHDAEEPPRPDPVPAGAADAQALRELAHALRTPAPVAPPVPPPTVTPALPSPQPASGAAPSRVPALMLGGVALLLAAVAALASLPVLYAAAAATAGAAVWLGTRRPTAAAPTPIPTPAPVAPASAPVVTGLSPDAVAQAAALGLPPDPDAVDAAAHAVAQREQVAKDHATWTQTRARLDSAASAARNELAERLTNAGHPVTGEDVIAGYADYMSACEQAAEIAKLAGERNALTTRVETARAQAAARASALKARESAVVALRAAADTVSAIQPTADLDSDGDPAALAAALRAWERAVSEQSRDAQDAEKAWIELDQLLGTGTLNDLRADAADTRARAERLADGLDPRTLAAARPVTLAAIEALEATATGRRSAAEKAAGALQQAQASLPDLTGAEEELAAARAELQRVNDLAETLGLAEKFMRSAQEKVHRDIAPRLAASISAALPGVTGDRYVSAVVDPKSLEVQVVDAGGRMRPARKLSYGTAEQVYLLLRLALVEHLTAGHDTCPLLLDDVTVHADAKRTEQILSLLHEVSEYRQVIVFTQQTQVGDWARATLSVERDAVVELEPVPV